LTSAPCLIRIILLDDIRTHRSIMITILAVALPGCAKPVSAPAPEDPPAQTVPDQPPEQEPAEGGDRDRKIDLDVDVDVGDKGVRVDVGEDGVQVDVGDDAERDQTDQP
jgi:hypothetical protein